MDDIEIIQLPVKRWKEFKDLRLKALKDDPQAFGASYEEVAKRSESYWKESLQDAIDGKSWCLFASFNNRLVGMLAASIHKDEPNRVWLHATYVDKNFRGKDIAKKLMQQMLENLKSSLAPKVIKLMVNKIQLPAGNLYKSFGFKIVDEQDFVMGNGQKARDLIMEKNLDEIPS